MTTKEIKNLTDLLYHNIREYHAYIEEKDERAEKLGIGIREVCRAIYLLNPSINIELYIAGSSGNHLELYSGFRIITAKNSIDYHNCFRPKVDLLKAQ